MIGRRDYEARKAARIERLRDRADAARAEGQGAYTRAKRLADAIPFGQPILVGHHSEKRHRRDAQRIHDGFGKSFRLEAEATALERRAAAAESNASISSDDPRAAELLRAKVAKLEADREEMKRLNAIHRKGGWEAVAADVGPTQAADLQRHASYTADKRPYPAYALTNIGAEIRRCTKRLEAFQREAARPAREPATFGSVTVQEEDNRVQITFPGKPSEEVRSLLKSRGFRWAPSSGAWQRMANQTAWAVALRLAEQIGEVA